MKITVRKIAEEAGVSPASVSRYINGSEDVSSEIASKVESALFSLGGSPVVRRPRKQIILILLTHLRFDFYGRTLAELLEQEPQSEYTFMLLRYNPQSPETVRNFVSRKKQFTAAFAFSDELAVGVMAALYDAGLRVPEDISVLGYDDLTIATRIRPALTTIHQPIDVFIEKSLELFRQPPKSIHSEILLPHSIVERQSCRRISDPVPKSV